MSGNFLGNFKVMAVILSIILFMLVMYGYNRVEKKKKALSPTQTQQAMSTVDYNRPNLGTDTAAKKGGCGCGKK